MRSFFNCKLHGMPALREAKLIINETKKLIVCARAKARKSRAEGSSEPALKSPNVLRNLICWGGGGMKALGLVLALV